nr:class I SAM-dependent methyltransferase [Massilia sp. JS1662]
MSIPANVKWWRFSPAQLLEKYADRVFDRVHGTQTRSFTDLKTLDVTGTNKQHGERYQPSPVYSLRRLLKRLDIHYPDFSFIDFGSGKGRTLLIAGELPFRQVIGVEFSADLHAQAQKNIACYGTRQAGAVIPVHADATEFELPQDDLVLYFFNPFSAPVLGKVLDNLLASLEAKPRRVILIYLYLPDAAWLDKLTMFTHRETWRNYVVLEASRASAAAMPSARST